MVSTNDCLDGRITSRHVPVDVAKVYSCRQHQTMHEQCPLKL